MKNHIKILVDKTRQSYRGLPDKKPYIEFFTTLLSVPVLLTVILLNINNLRAEKKTDAPPATPTPVKEIVYIPSGNNVQPQQKTNKQESATATPIVTITPSNTPSETCKKGIGSVEIVSPAEKEMVNKNPISVRINRPEEGYCAVVWAYRVNGASWSEYDDTSIALYNMANGDIRFELKVKSIVTGEEKILIRNFSYSGAPTPTASEAAQIAQ